MTYLHWVIIAAVFIVIEVFSFTYFFLFLGISSFIMAIIVAIYGGISLNIQMLLGSIFIILSGIMWYFFSKKNNHKFAKTNVNSRLNKYIGTKTVLLRDSQNGISQVSIEGSLWRILITEGKVGDEIEIIGVESTSFIGKLVIKQSN